MQGQIIELLSLRAIFQSWRAAHANALIQRRGLLALGWYARLHLLYNCEDHISRAIILYQSLDNVLVLDFNIDCSIEQLL